ncbi:MAG TPA: metalloregulator ArsR/SmtB family transcription factor [bacterium]|nr:metalloregulator ArsR/SmtB family transcription factor [bacterium]HPP87245.1 metalloregulator ArsR/SmtB family transcription factor [bacterium]
MLIDKVEIFKALGEEIRLRIFLLLLTQGELCVCDLENALKMSQPRISQHLLKLKNAGLINDKKVGKWKHYFLSKSAEKILKKNLVEIIVSLKTDKIIKNDLMSLKKFSIKKCEKNKGFF